MNRISYIGRVVIVTGGGAGFGRACAIDIARRGGAVVVNDLGGQFEGINHSMADNVVAEIRADGGNAIANYDNISISAGGAGLVDDAVAAFGRVDVVIHAAGYASPACFEDTSEWALNSMLDVHIKGAFNVIRPAYKVMKQQNYGRVVLPTSCVGWKGRSNHAAYGAAAAGIVGLASSLAVEGRTHGVQCNAVMLGDWQAEPNSAVNPESCDGVPLAVFLASENCKNSQAVYSCAQAAFRSAHLSFSQGWAGEVGVNSSAEDVERHWSQISSELAD